MRGPAGGPPVFGGVPDAFEVEGHQRRARGRGAAPPGARARAHGGRGPHRRARAGLGARRVTLLLAAVGKRGLRGPGRRPRRPPAPPRLPGRRPLHGPLHAHGHHLAWAGLEPGRPPRHQLVSVPRAIRHLARPGQALRGPLRAQRVRGADGHAGGRAGHRRDGRLDLHERADEGMPLHARAALRPRRPKPAVAQARRARPRPHDRGDLPGRPRGARRRPRPPAGRPSRRKDLAVRARPHRRQPPSAEGRLPRRHRGGAGEQGPRRDEPRAHGRRRRAARLPGRRRPRRADRRLPAHALARARRRGAAPLHPASLSRDGPDRPGVGRRTGAAPLHGHGRPAP